MARYHLHIEEPGAAFPDEAGADYTDDRAAVAAAARMAGELAADGDAAADGGRRIAVSVERDGASIARIELIIQPNDQLKSM